MREARRITSLLLVLVISSACDSALPVPKPEPEIQPSHFVAVINGQQWETTVAEGGFDGGGVGFTAYRKEGPYRAYYQSVAIRLPSRRIGRYVGSVGRSTPLDSLYVRVFEGDDHVLLGLYAPLDPPILTLTEVDTLRGVIAGTVSGTFVVDGNRGAYRFFPDTLQVRSGVFSIGLPPLTDNGP